MLHPNIHGSFQANRKKALDQDGVQLLTEKNEVKPNYALQTVLMVSGDEFEHNPQLHQEVFGPFTIVVSCGDMVQLRSLVANIEGQLTGTIIVEEDDFQNFQSVIDALSNRVGRVVLNGVPTGVEVTRAMTHGGPYPASTDSRFTAVGQDAVKRWLRPITYQNFPKHLLK